MHYFTPPLKNMFDHNKITPPKNTEDIFYEVQTTKCTQTLYKTGTICPGIETFKTPIP